MLTAGLLSEFCILMDVKVGLFCLCYALPICEVSIT
jgi:hypothetical protein